jgi:spermidine synthase
MQPMRLFLVSFLILFLELACIRWFGSTVVFLTFFTNVVLLATFLGMSVGCLAARDSRSLVTTVVPLLLVSVALALGVWYVYTHVGQIAVDVHQRSPQQIYFGTEYNPRDVARLEIPIEAIAGVFFLLIALSLVGLGQEMGRAFDATADRVKAYTLNIAGSLAGVAVFTALSYLRSPPELWFGIALALCLFFVPRWSPLQVYSTIAILVLVAMAAHLTDQLTIWSPYYKIGYKPNGGIISTNNIGHQQMIDVAKAGAGYHLPHILNTEAGAPPFEEVLVVGAGSGNDVAAALQAGAAHVDAVEIDPAIFAIGKRDHPNHPYDDRRVTVFIDDGRSFVRRSTKKYDLIIYALVDSLVLHSGYSSIRLESFLFTKDAFDEIAAHLKPGGVFAAYNAYRQTWLVGRLDKMMTAVFGIEPIVIPMPYRPRFARDEPTQSVVTFILASSDPARLARMRSRLTTEPPRLEGREIRPAAVDLRPGELVPTDDWPFLYLRDRVIPALNVRGMLVMAVLSAAIIAAFAPRRGLRPNWRLFFMGAGFMLIETKSVVHLALLFGATWMVNSIVVAAILLMILCSNLFVLLARPARVWPYYALLLASLAVAAAVPMNTFLNLPGSARLVASTAVVFVPVFFAGIVFATAFRDSANPDVDFASNIAGAMLGGLAESLSLVIGFNLLLAVAALFYALSAMQPRAILRRD